METLNGKIVGDLVVSNELSLLGLVTGSITVESGGRLYLHGMCDNNLIVKAGGFAKVNGMVGNDVHNGGSIEIVGVVNGNVLSIGSSLVKSDGAFIRGKILF